MIIDLDEYSLEIFFQHAQLEVTGKCNMRCHHCRAWDEARIDLSFPRIIKVIDFLISERDQEDLRLTISGGEPFLRKDLAEIVSLAKEKGISNIIITTNGSLVTEKRLAELIAIGVKNLSIQVSLDGISPAIHDSFREYNGAFEKAVHALQLVAASPAIASLRTTVLPATIKDLDRLVDLGLSLGVERIGIGSVIPAGRGKLDESILMKPQEKQRLLSKITSLKRQYPKVDITTEDPLKFCTNDPIWEYGNFDIHDEAFFGGCTAGITGFNVDSDGLITPCAVLLEPILKVGDQDVEAMVEAYQNSKVIKSLISRDFIGKCGTCSLKRLCGGCRAVAQGHSGNYLGSDATCWK